jgi:hypothetical protein
MKKAGLNLVIVLALIAPSLQAVHAQDSTAHAVDTTATTPPPPPAESSAPSEPSTFRFNFSAGLAFSSLTTNSYVTKSSSDVGYMVGFSGSTAGNFFIQPGIQFTSYVSNVSFNPNGGAVGADDHFARFNYIRVPVQAGFRLFSRNSAANALPFNVELRLGASGSFLVGTTDIVNGTPFVKDDVESFRPGLVGGLGVQVLFLSLNFEYEAGLSNHFANSKAGDSKLNAFYLIFGGSF